jgi:hypothetical protein
LKLSIEHGRLRNLEHAPRQQKFEKANVVLAASSHLLSTLLLAIGARKVL